MKQMFQRYISVFGAIAAITLGLVGTAAPVSACTGIECAKIGSEQVKTGGANSSDWKTVLQTVTNVLLLIVGAVSVIMIVIGGLKYTTSNGEAKQIESAKNTILYAVIGIVVAIFAYAIVQFIISSFAGDSTPSQP